MKSTHVMPLRIPVLLLGVLLLLTAFLATGALSASANGVLHVPGDFDTIQDAVDDADPGDIIQVAAGIYNEQVKIDGMSGLELRGQDAVLQGSEDGIGIKIVDSDHVLVQGFIVENYGAGIVLDGTDDSEIRNVEIRFNDNVDSIFDGNGLDLINSHDNEITNVFVHHNGHNGITLKGGSTHNIIKGSKLFNNGINQDVLTFPAGCGIQLSRDGNHENTIIDNKIVGNAFGILLSGPNAGNPDAPGADNNTIKKNRVHGNGRSGIDVRDGSSGNMIAHNNAKGNAFLPNGTFDLRDQGAVDNTWIDNKGNFGS